MYKRQGYYDVAADKIDSYSAYICGSGAYPDEIAVFQMKSADDVNACLLYTSRCV